MLRKSKTLTGFKLHATDGEIGKVKDFYFDDRHWTARYLVVDTGNWLTGRQVLISPHAITAVDADAKRISINLSKAQIEGSPSSASDKPISQQYEDSYHIYYGYPNYYCGGHMWAISPGMLEAKNIPSAPSPEANAWDRHLRSMHVVGGFHIQATDGEIGHIHEFLVDDETWTIRYLIIDTKNWWPGKMVIVSTQWIDNASWSQAKVFMKISREEVMTSPEYTKDLQLTREYEAALHGHYRRPGYWNKESSAK